MMYHRTIRCAENFPMQVGDTLIVRQPGLTPASPGAMHRYTVERLVFKDKDRRVKEWGTLVRVVPGRG